PYIPCGRSAPPLPIAIQCISMTEAQHVQSAMQHVLDTIVELHPSTTQLLKAFGNSSVVQNLLPEGPFYAVVVGTPAGIHRTSSGITETVQKASEQSFAHPKWRETNTLWEALVYLVVKGVDEHMPTTLTASARSQGSVQICATSSLDAWPNTSVTTLGTPALTQIVSGSPTTRPLHGMHPLLVASCLNGQYTVIQETLNWVLRGLPASKHLNQSAIIYSHVQTLHGISQTQYFYSPPPAETHRCIHALGNHATGYLAAHGYTHSTIDTIIDVLNSSHSERNFALRLSQQGMPLAESQYLWYLIHL
ncbi:hypothetical protein SCLCIDRAFT_110561, partial [Scleroderma citrinum Foug A]